MEHKKKNLKPLIYKYYSYVKGIKIQILISKAFIVEFDAKVW